MSQPFAALIFLRIRPQFSQVPPTQWIVSKVDHVPMVIVSRARIHLLTADVGKDRIPVARFFRDEPVHLGERSGNPFPDYHSS